VWNCSLVVIGAGVFVLMVGLWVVVVWFGYVGVVLFVESVLLLWLFWLVHLFSILVFVTIVVEIGGLVVDLYVDVSWYVCVVFVVVYGGYVVLFVVIYLVCCDLVCVGCLVVLIVFVVLVVLLVGGILVEGVVWVFVVGVLVVLVVNVCLER